MWIKQLSLVPLALTVVALSCSSPEEPATTSAAEATASHAAESLVIYSGRNESLVGPILTRFSEATGVEVEVRYGGTAEMAATVLEEGARTPADLFFSQDAAALGALSAAGLLRPLDATTLERIPARFRSPDGTWVGVSGRARSLVYNPDLISVEELPQSLEEMGQPRYKGTFGLPPTNASFQAHLAVLHTLSGRESVDSWLENVVGNDAQIYAKNSPIVEAVIAGEIEWGLVNHYYLWRALKENPEAPGRNFFMPAGEASSFVNVAGVGVLSDHPRLGELVAFLLSDAAQTYFAEETYEYPLVASVAPAVDLPPLDSVGSPEVDFAQVSANLESTLEAIHLSGLLQ